MAIFPTCLSHCFGPKIAIYPTPFFLGKRDTENVFSDILEGKNAYLKYKDKKIKKS